VELETALDYPLHWRHRQEAEWLQVRPKSGDGRRNAKAVGSHSPRLCFDHIGLTK